MPAIRGSKSKSKTRRRTRDLDQLHADAQDEKHLTQFTETKSAEDLPALGEWYCKSCARWFDSDKNFEAHQQGKKHKKMLAFPDAPNFMPFRLTPLRDRLLKEEPYSQREADASVGLWTDNGKEDRPVSD
ncbi:MAG: Bud site selection protein 20 [Bathelium mastoideum]|nr:MAG: Bud site selection protein 20 [Bathelium mastoideum]